MSAPNAPFFVVFRFFQPSPKSGAKNAAHVIYIGRRPGVDKDGDAPPIDHDVHLHYMDHRPRSHGLFGPEGDTQDIQDVAATLKHHDGIVWRGILSLREDDAIKYGFTNRRRWENALRATLPELGSQLGIAGGHFKWVAAFHKEPGHYHVHVVFWDSTSSRTRGRLTPRELKGVRGLMMREIYGDERRRLLEEKTRIRNDARASISTLTKAPFSMPRDPVGIALRNQLLVLSRSLPSTGRTALAYMPPAVKQEARRIADWILSQDGYAAQTARYLEIAGDLARHHSRQQGRIDSAKDEAFSDLRDRVAQVVLKGAAFQRRSITSAHSRARSVMFVFPQVWTLLNRERQRIEREALRAEAGEYLRGATADQSIPLDRQREIDRQKEVERA